MKRQTNRANKKLLHAIPMLAIAIILALVSIPPVSAIWDGNASISPSSAYEGAPTDFTVTVTNSRSSALTVYWITVRFGWQTSSTTYYFKANDGTTTSIPGYGSGDFSSTITVPQSTSGQYSVEINVNAQGTGDWWAETKTVTDYVTVNIQPSGGEAIITSALNWVPVVVIAIIIISATAIVLKKVLSKPSKPGMS
jgi:hypothetical protein